jgi:outer membrane lipoprotein SlyB
LKNLVTMFRSAPVVMRLIWVLEAISLVFVMSLLAMESAHAQAGNIYAPQQAQVAGDVTEAQVLQVFLREVQPSNQARAAGAAVGGVLGLALASRAGNRDNRFAVNTVGTVVGGLLGERAASTVASSQAQEIILRLQSHGQQRQQARTLIIVQPTPFEAVSPGEWVYVTVVNGAYRVIRRDML